MNTVVIGILLNDRGEVFVQKRPLDKIYGDFWEFPGGKLEKNETALQALNREFLEELSVDTSAEPWKAFHQMSTPSGELYFFLSKTSVDYAMKARENQPMIRWQSVDLLEDLNFLKNNQAVIDKLKAIKGN